MSEWCSHFHLLCSSSLPYSLCLSLCSHQSCISKMIDTMSTFLIVRAASSSAPAPTRLSFQRRFLHTEGTMPRTFPTHPTPTPKPPRTSRPPPHEQRRVKDHIPTINPHHGHRHISSPHPGLSARSLAVRHLHRADREVPHKHHPLSRMARAHPPYAADGASEAATAVSRAALCGAGSVRE